MEEEVERDRLIRDSLELELQALRKRLLMVENSQSMDMSSGELSTKDQFLRSESSCGLFYTESFIHNHGMVYDVTLIQKTVWKVGGTYKGLLPNRSS